MKSQKNFMNVQNVSFQFLCYISHLEWDCIERLDRANPEASVSKPSRSLHSPADYSSCTIDASICRSSHRVKQSRRTVPLLLPPALAFVDVSPFQPLRSLRIKTEVILRIASPLLIIWWHNPCEKTKTVHILQSRTRTSERRKGVCHCLDSFRSKIRLARWIGSVFKVRRAEFFFSSLKLFGKFVEGEASGNTFRVKVDFYNGPAKVARYGSITSST